MKYTIDLESNIPLYKQVIQCVKEAIRNGQLKNGDALPSLSAFSSSTGISMETAKKAYNLLKKEGLLSGRKGKGFFVDIRKKDEPLKILMLLDKLSSYKLSIHKGLMEGLSSAADISIMIHNQDIRQFEKMVGDSMDDYDFYLIAAHFTHGTRTSRIARILKRIPNDKLILIDHDLPQVKGHIGRIYQDFHSDAPEALRSGIHLLQKYQSAVIISSSQSLYGEVICPGIKQLFKSEGIRYKVEKQFDASLMKPGTLFIVLCGQLDTDHFTLLKEAAKKGFILGKDIGLVTYNDEPVNEFISGGLTCISSDFEKMGRHAAEMINTKCLYSVHNPFRLTIRSSL